MEEGCAEGGEAEASVCLFVSMILWRRPEWHFFGEGKDCSGVLDDDGGPKLEIPPLGLYHACVRDRFLGRGG